MKHTLRNLGALLGLLLCSQMALAAATRYVTDRIVLDLYQDANPGSQVLKQLPTGTSMTLLEAGGSFAKVKLADGTIGYVEASFITDERPLQVLYNDLQAKYKKLSEQSAASDANDSGSGSSSASDADLARLKLDAKNAGWMKAEISKSRDRIKELESALKTASDDKEQAQSDLANFKAQLTGTIIPVAAQAAGNESGGASMLSFHDDPAPAAWYKLLPIPLAWVAALALTTLISGYFIGMYILDRRIRRQHGGFRLYQ